MVDCEITISLTYAEVRFTSLNLMATPSTTLKAVAVWFFFFQAEDGIRDYKVTGVQTCALPIWAEGHLDHRELGQLCLDAVEGGLVLDHFPGARGFDDRVFKRSASVLGRVELVEMLVAAAAKDVAEAHARRVDVEEDRGGVARVPKGMHNV